jgi:hypothetical protein
MASWQTFRAHKEMSSCGRQWTSADRQLRRMICLTFLWRRPRQGLVKYSFDQRVFRQVFMVLSYDRFLPIFIFPVYFGQEIHHMRHLFSPLQTRTGLKRDG